MSTPVRVLLVDDQQLVRSGFRLILSVEDDMEVVGEAADGAAAVARARALRPDVVLMDVQMPGTDGIEATRQLVAEGLGPVVMLTTFDRDDYLFDALDAGATGFLLKNSDPDALVAAVRAAASGHALLAPEVTLRVIERMTTAAPADDPARLPPPELARLTDREREVLLLLGQGLSNAEIAERLVLGEATVKTYVSGCLAKLHLRDRVRAVVWVHQHHLLPAEEDGTGRVPPSG
ncbi:LuxR family transcriptional regulator [Nocardioides sp. Root190]|uniref:response regulator n=1 Tax=Nocardioides sp. Root190 TaxID=1736488 RepID=UPI0006F2DB8B|nr:response regulator transcription factor [Nocardioides sp. Root190]KRB76894.1 LuxR family transcriptional regulator [Nocardioides sp. Root190]